MTPHVETPEYRHPDQEFGSERSCAFVRESAAAYALGALETDDSDRIAEHRLLCPECDRALMRLGAVTPLIGLAAPSAVPSANVKTGLLAAVAAEPRVENRSTRTTPQRTEPPVAPKPSRVWWQRAGVSSGALALAVAALGLWGVYAGQELSSRSDTIAQLERSNEALTVHLSSLQQGQLAFGADASSIQLMNVSTTADDAGGVVVSGSGETTTVFSVWNMPTEHESYHVICESSRGELLAAGEILINDHGNGTVTITLPSPLSNYRAVHVLPTSSSGAGAGELLANDILQALVQEPQADTRIEE